MTREEKIKKMEERLASMDDPSPGAVDSRPAPKPKPKPKPKPGFWDRFRAGSKRAADFADGK